jgi:putative spermidine/putrescine transport system ATP-binding protein
VFQNYALFPHMTIEENISFPLKMRRMDGPTTRRRAREALELVRLPQVASRFPKELSGGQQQRIALARSLVYQPSIVLMDEPLGALDKKLRDQMQLEIKRIHRETGATIVYVTHDQEEAMTMSDRICLMNGGQIEQLGTPSDLYFRPSTLFVADFLGESNLLPGSVDGTDGRHATVLLADGVTRVRAVTHVPLAAGTAVRVMVRPQNVSLGDGANGDFAMRGRVLDSMITGSLTKLYLQVPAMGEAPVIASYPTSAAIAPYLAGCELAVHWHAGDAVAVPEAS